VAHGRSLELARIQPRTRVRRAMPPSQRRKVRERSAPHTRAGPQRSAQAPSQVRKGEKADLAIWHTTRPRPWVLRERRRAANRRVRAARRRNR